MFRLAIDAGHYIKTAGRRVSKKFDKNQTREWTLNDRIARYVSAFAAQYEGVETRRVDDESGKTLVGLQARCDRANDWKADFYLSVHHNAGINGGKGGGIVAYGYKEPLTYRDAIYDACVKATGLKGNRAKPKVKKGFYVLKKTKMPAVLMECGFMDSATDAPVILTDAYAQKMAQAMMEAVAQVAGLQKKTEEKKEAFCKVDVQILKKGAKGEAVRAMQYLLEANGCKGKMDSKKYGDFGTKTEAALKLYQKKTGLKETGVCDKADWEYLLGVIQ